MAPRVLTPMTRRALPAAVALVVTAMTTAHAARGVSRLTPSQGLPACPGTSGTGRFEPCDSETQLRELMQARINRLQHDAFDHCGSCLYPAAERTHLTWLKALMESKHVVYHMMRVLGVQMARRYFCTTNVRDLLRLHSRAVGAPMQYALKRLEGSGAHQVYVMINGTEQLRNRRYSLAAIVAERIKADGGAQKGYNYAVEELVYSAADPTHFANDVKVHVFGGTLGYTLFLPKRSNKGPDVHACQVCLHCAHTKAGCKHANDLTESYDMFLYKRKGMRVQCPVPARAHVMHALSAALGRAFGLFMRVDWYESLPLPILSEITVVPAWSHFEYKMKRSMWYQHGSFAHQFAQLWHGVEGGGSGGEPPCWLPSDWRTRLHTCQGLGKKTLEELMAENCVPAKHRGRGSGDPSTLAHRLQKEVTRWRRAKREIAAIYANASQYSAAPATPIPAQTQCVDD